MPGHGRPTPEQLWNERRMFPVHIAMSTPPPALRIYGQVLREDLFAIRRCAQMFSTEPIWELLDEAFSGVSMHLDDCIAIQEYFRESQPFVWSSLENMCGEADPVMFDQARSPMRVAAVMSLQWITDQLSMWRAVVSLLDRELAYDPDAEHIRHTLSSAQRSNSESVLIRQAMFTDLEGDPAT